MPFRRVHSLYLALEASTWSSYDAHFRVNCTRNVLRLNGRFRAILLASKFVRTLQCKNKKKLHSGRTKNGDPEMLLPSRDLVIPYNTACINGVTSWLNALLRDSALLVEYDIVQNSPGYFYKGIPHTQVRVRGSYRSYRTVG